MKVYVINNNDNLLMPCKLSKARKLLRDGKAKAVKRTPFTIQLRWDCEENVQPIRLGIDKGNKTTGFCAVGNGEIQISGHIKHRTDVSKKMTVRAANRSQRSGRLPPSIKTNIEEVLRVVKKLPLPITTVVVEDVLIDIAKLNNPQLQGKDYQQSNRLREHDDFEKVYGYQTAYFRKQLGLEKDHDSDATATMKQTEKIAFHKYNFYLVNFGAKQTRRLYRDLPVKGKGRVKYQINQSADGFSKGDVVLVNNKYIKQINSIYSNGSLAFKPIKGDPNTSVPNLCRLFEHQSTMVFSAIQ